MAQCGMGIGAANQHPKTSALRGDHATCCISKGVCKDCGGVGCIHAWMSKHPIRPCGQWLRKMKTYGVSRIAHCVARYVSGQYSEMRNAKCEMQLLCSRATRITKTPARRSFKAETGQPRCGFSGSPASEKLCLPSSESIFYIKYAIQRH